MSDVPVAGGNENFLKAPLEFTDLDGRGAGRGPGRGRDATA